MGSWVNEILEKGFDQIKQEAYAAGQQDASKGAFTEGVGVGIETGINASRVKLAAAATVVNAWFNGDYTVLLFADGEKEKVKKQDCDSAYDAEKAIMACILKHVVGNVYIDALREFVPMCPYGQTEAPVAPVSGYITEGEAYGYDEDDALADMLAELPSEPGFGQDVFRG